MQYRKCVALLAVLLVGFGVIAVNDANAATVSSVTITSPADSGALRGIDSTFVVQAVVTDFSPHATDKVIFFLTTGASTTAFSVVNDAVNTGSGDLAAAIIAAGNVATLPNQDATPVNQTSGGNFVAVRATRNAAPTTPLTIEGDGDSVKVTVSNETATYTWYGKVHHTSGVVNAVYAGAVAYDNTGTATSDAKLSATSRKFNIDADRPIKADAILTLAAAVPINKTGSPNHTVVIATTPAVSNTVLGIGDTIGLNVKLGAQASGVLSADSLSVVADVFGKVRAVSKTARSLDTLNYRYAIGSGDYGNMVGAVDITASDTLAVYIVDLAGNLDKQSSANDDEFPAGVTVAVKFYVDGTAPVLDGAVVAGDTILPVSNDTITDGGVRSTYPIDSNPITFKLAEALDTLFVTFNDKITLKVGNTTSSQLNPALSAGATRSLDFTWFGDTGPGPAATDTFRVVNLADSTVALTYTGGATTVARTAAADTTLTTGSYTIKFQGQDLAGNKGAVLSRSGVYLDVDDIALGRLFPTSASALDTLEEATSKVVFQLSEVADSVRIAYFGIAGVDKDSTRARVLAGTELTGITSEQTFTVAGLKNNTKYTLQILAADLAGNYTQTALDSFVYDTSFVVPVIAKFAITANTTKTGTHTGAGIAAGDTLLLTVKALTVTDVAAVTYKEVAELKVTTGSGVTLTGTGVTDLGNGRATLSADDWVIGSRTVVLKDTTSVDTLHAAVQDCTDTTNIFVGALDSVIAVAPAARSKIVVDAPASAGQGDMFWVGVNFVDVYGNTRVADNGFVSITANKLGVEVPVGDLPITKGTGGFYAKSNTWAGDGLVFTIKDVILPTTGSPTQTSGTDTMSISGAAVAVLDAPDTLIAQDYMGAKGMGDQGGFITLSFPPSADHATLTGYRIYREVAVFSGYNTATPPALVGLSEPVMAMIPWGIVDAVPGADPMRVVVATLDGDSTKYAVAAERGTLTTAKSAFDGAESVANPYEMLAATMQQSRAAATDGPIFASLTPEALAFSANGIAPRMKLVDGVVQSSITQTASAVRSVDNIAPEAVAFMQTMDTPADAGSSITVTWAKSVSDQMVTVVVPQAIGGSNVYTTSGVKGYNVYRKVGDAAYTLVGAANAGETSFVDETAFNGVRYTYQVRPFDADNITASAFEKSAMAIRNNVVDASGAPVYGLFGIDNKVDYDDFFIFADNFGLSAGQDSFDRAFDLVPNNTVDFDDFFAFADNFGREIVATGKVVPMMAGLNSDARFYLDAGSDLPRVGEELVIDVNLENFVELQAYGFGMNYDASVLEFVGARVENSILGEGQLAQPQVFTQSEGTVSLGAFGDVATKGELGLSLVFRTLGEIESSYIEITEGALQDGSYGLNNVIGPVSVRIETRPEVYALSDNYPNPFNPETTIKYQLPEAGDVTLEVYNMLGQVVRSLVSEQQSAGRYVLQWDATNDAGHALSSGIYFYRIVAGGEFQSVKKMLLLK